MQRKDDHTEVIPVRRPADDAPRRLGEEPAARPETARSPEPAGASSPPVADEASPPPSAAEAEHPCPHCGAEMIDHDAPEGTPKHNAWHCNACGGCFVHRGSAWYLRAGHVAPAGWTGNT